MNRRKLVALVVALGLLAVPSAYAVSWLDFAHPTSPHLDPALTDPDVHLIIPELFDTPGDVTASRPVLVILMEFSDTTHQAVHNVPYWRDLVFANPRPGVRPSIAQVYQESSNGRLLLVPATTGDLDGAQDGVVGWVRSTHGFSELSPEQKRAEAIRVADPLFDFFRYDSNNDHIISNDELVVLAVFGDQSGNNCCDEHIGHPPAPGCANCPGGNTRRTDPAQVAVDQDTGSPGNVYQQVAGVGEMAHEGVAAHELGHTVLGGGDLYEACNTNLDRTWDGYRCTGVWYPPPPGVYSLMAGYRVDYACHPDPWNKIHLGFVKPVVVTHDGTYTLYDAETQRNFSAQSTQPEALVIYDPLRSQPYQEYFILENRNQTLLPDRGLAVWLINEQGNWARGVVRLIRRGAHWAADADALWDGVDGTQGYDLTATSTPRNTSWTDGTPSYVEVYDISAAGPSMTFNVRMPPIFVDRSNTGRETGSQANPFNTVAEGVSAIPEAPRTIRIAGGSYAETPVINTPSTLMGWRNGDAVIGR